MSELAKFHLLAHIFISAIGGILLLAIWYNIKSRFKTILEEGAKEKRVDKGLLFLSLAMFTWVLAGLWGLAGYQFDFINTSIADIGERLFSIINNLFLLLSLFYFYYAPPFIYNNKKGVKIVIGIIFIVSILTLLLNNFGLGATADINIANIPDLLLSIFLSGLLMISFYKTFVHRGLKIVAIISVIVITLMMISQFQEVFPDIWNRSELVNNLLKIVSKTSLIAICLVLATTWVIRLASMPKPNEMNIVFQDWSLIKLSVPSKDIHNQLVDFGSKTTQYKNLLKFAIRRKYGEGDQQSILVGNGGELSNQTYLTRIINNINKICQYDENQKLERRDLFNFIGTGMYRLRIIPENISIDEGLLAEFTKSIDNQVYKSLCN